MIKYIGFILRVVPYLIIKYPAILFNYLKRKSISFVKRYAFLKKIITNVMKGLHVEFHVNGLEKLKAEKSYVLTPNHQSFLDGLSFIAILNDPSTFVAKIEAKKYPFVGKAIGIIDGLFLERSNLRQEIKVMTDLKKSLKNDNKKWIIFPEGTRTRAKDYAMADFKAGTFKAPTSAGVSIYPVAMWGSFRVLDIKLKRMKRYPIQISILDPITPQEYDGLSTAEIAKLVQSKVEAEVKKLKEKEKELLK